MTTLNPIQLHAHAKLNLALSVAPPDPTTGMHPICSWMHAIELSDKITLTRLNPTEPSQFSVRWDSGKPVDWPTEHDLAFRAHAALQAAVARSLPCNVEIIKSIPAGGGLGGGSSDAATALLGLNAMFELNLSEAELLEIARPIGSDIAFFLDTGVPLDAPPRPAIVSGFGDRVERLEPRDAPLTLFIPGFGCPTRAVYDAYDQNPSPLEEARVRRLATEPELPAAELFNDLTEPAGMVEPRVRVMLDALNPSPSKPAHLSGSGSTVFTMSHHPGPVPQACTAMKTKLV